MIFQHENQGGGLHQFKFPSTTRRGVHHILSVDVDLVTFRPAIACSCEAALFARLCKHVRWLIHGGRAS